MELTEKDLTGVDSLESTEREQSSGELKTGVIYVGGSELSR